jgi:glucosamine 6-phosphate synthetase-like amidotransferase/phosphosugar isomerase protein
MFALHEEERNTENNIAAITTSLGQLEGTFGLWIYDSNRKTMFLARCGSTLFANVLTNEFSSIKFKNSEPLEEGHLYQLTPEGVTSVDLFDFDSPFFT